jgi:Prokaryotic E2 family E/Multiubiquitin
MTEVAHKTHITILVNEKPYHVTSDKMTGAQIKALASVPPENRLFLEVPGPGDDIFIPDGESIELKSGEQFYDLPRGVHGAPTLLDRIAQEVAALEQEFGRCEARPQPDGTIALIIGPVDLPDGWATRASRIVLVVPPGYPDQRPTGFFADQGLTLVGGAAPKCSGQSTAAGEQMTSFCWNPANWDPAKDGLWKYAKLMAERFDEAA